MNKLTKELEQVLKIEKLVQGLEKSNITDKDIFRAKDLGDNFSHSGSTLTMFMTMDVIEHVGSKKEEIEITKKEKTPYYRNTITNEIITQSRYYDIRYPESNNYQRVIVENKKTIISEYRLYKLNSDWKEKMTNAILKLANETRKELVRQTKYFNHKITELLVIINKGEEIEWKTFY